MTRVYRNTDGSLPVLPGSVFRWAVTDRLLGRRRLDRRPFETPRLFNDGSALRSNQERPLLTWVGHATWVIQLSGVNILVDPIWTRAIGGVVRRNGAPGVAMEKLPRVDVVLLTHNHRDHMDIPTLRALKDAALAVVPMGLVPAMKRLGFSRVVELDWWTATDFGAVRFTLVPSQHWSRRGLHDANRSLCGGYYVQSGGLSVYHSGDTAYFSGFADIKSRMGPPDAALLPIGAYEPEWFMRRQHMNPEDAIQAGLDLGARQMLAMHWGTYALTDEWLGEPPQKFLEIASRREVQHRVQVLPVGGMVDLRQGVQSEES